MIYFSIKELEAFSGIKAHTIRTWEQRFTFLQPQRTSKLRRTYSVEELKLLLDVSLLNRNGYKVSHIARMDKLKIEAVIDSLAAPSQLHEKAVNGLIACMAEMNIAGFEKILEDLFLSGDTSYNILGVILPFTRKTGMLPQVSKAYKPNLLLIEQSIKQKIILGLENAPLPNPEKVALFILHKKSTEMELLYTRFLLKTKGIFTIFLGNFNSLRNLETITAGTKPDYIISSPGDKKQVAETKKYLQFLNKHFPHIEFYNLGKSKFPGPFGDISFNDCPDSEQLAEMLLQKTPAVALQKSF